MTRHCRMLQICQKENKNAISVVQAFHFLSEIIFRYGMRPDTHKLYAQSEMSSPKTKKDPQSSLETT